MNCQGHTPQLHLINEVQLFDPLTAMYLIDTIVALTVRISMRRLHLQLAESVA